MENGGGGRPYLIWNQRAGEMRTMMTELQLILEVQRGQKHQVARRLLVGLANQHQTFQTFQTLRRPLELVMARRLAADGFQETLRHLLAVALAQKLPPTQAHLLIPLQAEAGFHLVHQIVRQRRIALLLLPLRWVPSTANSAAEQKTASPISKFLPQDVGRLTQIPTVS
tara:strand:- start:1584 stop:2090 length:507 start_codon:yes stop_codon:yes gene_type:complete